MAAVPDPQPAPVPAPASTDAGPGTQPDGTKDVVTYTQEQVDRLLQDDRTAAGRSVKTLEDRSAELATGEGRLADRVTAWEKERDDAEVEAAKASGEPNALQDLQVTQEARRWTWISPTW